MSEIDSTDQKIVDLLMSNGRMACAEIGRRLGGISERVVRYRLDRLIQEGIIEVVAVPKPMALGYSVVADVFVEVEPGAILDVARRLAEYECVSYVACAMGEVDVSIQVVGRDNTEVFSFVTQTIAGIPGVRKTTTLIVPMVLKDVYQWRIPSSACLGTVGAQTRQDGAAPVG
jgi:Lrp/AsnC family transcriptional regulator for asnA, asnC and gidA